MTFTRLFTATKTEIKVSPNHSRRTFTLRKNGTTYRTNQMSKDEFQSATYWTGNDWSQFFKTDEYYIVK